MKNTKFTCWFWWRVFLLHLAMRKLFNLSWFFSCSSFNSNFHWFTTAFTFWFFLLFDPIWWIKLELKSRIKISEIRNEIALLFILFCLIRNLLEVDKNATSYLFTDKVSVSHKIRKVWEFMFQWISRKNVSLNHHAYWAHMGHFLDPLWIPNHVGSVVFHLWCAAGLPNE